MMVKNQAKRQHFLPKSYLKNFCGQDGQLHLCIMRKKEGRDEITSKWTKGTPESVGYEKDLYTLDAENGNQLAVEKELADSESKAMPRIMDILQQKPEVLRYNTSSEIIEFIAYMAMRVPSALKMQTALVSGRKAMMISGGMKNNPGPSGISENVDAIRPYLRKWNWYPYFFDGKDGRILVTSDRPVGIYRLDEEDPRSGRILQPSPVMSGVSDNWTMPAIHTFPLSWSTALLGFQGPKNKLEHWLNNGQLNLYNHGHKAAWINAMTAHQANYVYSSCKNPMFLLPNKPGETRNLPGLLKEYVTAIADFDKQHNIPIDKLARIIDLP